MIVESILNSNKSKSDFPSFFKINNEKISNKQAIADNFNLFFSTIGPKLADKLDGQGKPSFTSYLSEPIPHHFNFNEITEKDSIKIITKAANKSSCGFDGISMKMIKNISDSISKPLTMIINQSLLSGVVPSNMKTAKVVPLF